jgi:SpoIID/LytB domain protein
MGAGLIYYFMNLNKQIKDLFASQASSWDLAKKNINDLQTVETKTFSFGEFDIYAQFNPARIVSSGAKVDAKSIQERKCFLCESHRPAEQKGIQYRDKFEILINPFPILPLHFTIPRTAHVQQEILPYVDDMLDLAKDLDEFIILYNGPLCGASAPDHMHFQAAEKGHLPIEKEFEKLKISQSKNILNLSDGECYAIEHYLRSCIVIESSNKQTAKEIFEKTYQQLQNGSNEEPMMNVFCLYKNNTWVTFIFPRAKHRPTQYFAEGDDNMMISPGAIDIAGIFIMPQRKDFDKLNNDLISDVMQQVSKNIDEPTVSVGIMNEKEITFVLNGNFSATNGQTYSGEQKISFQIDKLFFDGNSFAEIIFTPTNDDCNFDLIDVTIGINFHWERKENQRFNGSVKFIIEDKKVTAINTLLVEDYLKSVISSEMSATASFELLKAHAVISRSWLLANMGSPLNPPQGDFKKAPLQSPTPLEGLGEAIKWYERDAHSNFDVCADDHCQRYQGITRTNTQTAIDAINATHGEVLMSDGNICDARFSKSCGGISEKFENCWAETPYKYLTNIIDNDKTPEGFNLDLTIEKNAEKWIRHSPAAFCNTTDKKILSQVLNNYDQETTDFFRWKVVYSQQKLSALLLERSGIDFGNIIDLIPIQRGVSGRLIKLKIVGTKQTIVVGKELEIRKWLSTSHLYSSAFVIGKTLDENNIPSTFTLIGAGWGHGVGLCQIGAAVMGEKGYQYKEILLHYYKNAEIKRNY